MNTKEMNLFIDYNNDKVKAEDPSCIDVVPMFYDGKYKMGDGAYGLFDFFYGKVAEYDQCIDFVFDAIEQAINIDNKLDATIELPQHLGGDVFHIRLSV
jgi:hypothetical protein